MTQIVRFRTASGSFAVDVEHVREVRTPEGLSPLPAPIEGVAGILRAGADALTVLDVLGGGERQVLLLEPAGRRFGLLVEEVTGVSRINPDRIGPAPAGQAEGLVTGVIEIDDVLVLLVDAVALERRLER